MESNLKKIAKGVLLAVICALLVGVAIFEGAILLNGNNVGVDVNLGQANDDFYYDGGDGDGDSDLCQAYMDGFNRAVQDEWDRQKAVNLTIQAKKDGCKWVKTYSSYICGITEGAIVDSAGSGDTGSVRTDKDFYSDLNCR